MIKYVIGVLVVLLLVAGTFIYKIDNRNPFYHFPGEREAVNAGIDAPVYLYLFMSKSNCKDCLGIVNILNRVENRFIVNGLVPDNELADEKELREITGARFPLKPAGGYKKYAPFYWPMLVGVTEKNTVLFSIPAVPGQEEYLIRFLDTFYPKVYPMIIRESK